METIVGVGTVGLEPTVAALTDGRFRVGCVCLFHHVPVVWTTRESNPTAGGLESLTG